MLGTRKLKLLATAKVHGLEIRMGELNYYIQRYYAMAGLSALFVGMAYVGLIKIKLPEHMEETVEEYFFEQFEKRHEHSTRILSHIEESHGVHGEVHGVHGAAHGVHGEVHGPAVWPWQVSAFFFSASSTMALALLNLTLTSFLLVGAQGMILRGPSGSVQKCTGILSEYWLVTCAIMGATFLSFLASVMSIQWMKLEDAPRSPASAIFCTLLFVGVMLMTFRNLRRMTEDFAIPEGEVVDGSLTIEAQNAKGSTERIDLAGDAGTHAELM